MQTNFSLFKKGLCVLCSSILISTGSITAHAINLSPSVHNTNEVTTTKSSTISTNEAYVYYVSNSVLYRAMSDGTKSQKLLNSFTGTKLTPAGDNCRLYRMNDDGITSIKLSDEKVDRIVLISKL